MTGLATVVDKPIYEDFDGAPISPGRVRPLKLWSAFLLLTIAYAAPFGRMHRMTKIVYTSIIYCNFF